MTDALPRRSIVRTPKTPSLLTDARAALACSESEKVIKLTRHAINHPTMSEDNKGIARCLLAEALETLSREREALEVLSIYQKREDACIALSPATLGQVYLRLGSAYGYIGNPPLGITYAQQALALADEDDSLSIISGKLLLGRLYRAMGETGLARLQYGEAIEMACFTGSQLLLAQAFLGRGTLGVVEGDLMGARQDFEHGREHLGVQPAILVRGHLESNGAVLAILQGRPRDGIAMLERAISYYTRVGNPRLISNATNNLGFILLQLGEIERARQCLEKALALTRSHGLLLAESGVLETTGEMKMIQGAGAEAESLLRQSIEIARTAHGGFNEAQSHLTLGRYYLLADDLSLAEESFQCSEQICVRINDRRGQLAAKLFLAETRLVAEDQAAASRLLAEAHAEAEELNHLPSIAHGRELRGRLALAEGNRTEAVTLLQQAGSVYDLIGHRYRAGVAYYHLGHAQKHAGESRRTRRAFEQAEEIFQALDARPMLKKTAAALATLTPSDTAHELTARPPDTSTAVISVVCRLLEASHSPELLLRELALVLHDEFGASPVIIYERRAEGALTMLCSNGCSELQAASLSEKVARMKESTASEAESHVPRLYHLRAGDSPELLLYLGAEGSSLSQSLIARFMKQIAAQLELIRFRPSARALPFAASGAVSDLKLPGLVYQSAAMRHIAEQIYAIRDSQIRVLITGEPGTGKELVARAVHTLSRRASSSFVPVNCAAIPGELIESQLFGHRRGAFTGAHQDHLGFIREAAEGTLFLDEIGELSIVAQPKFLRLLESGEIQPVGESRPRQVNVRVLAATNRSLPELIAAGRFRADLYDRLNILNFHLPPLRERREDIPLLAERFLQVYSQRESRERLRLSPEAMELLRAYDWPGNVRQLSSEIERLIAFTPRDNEITAGYLSSAILQQRTPIKLAQRPTLDEARESLDRRMLLEALSRYRGNKSQAAKELGLSRPGLRKMLERAAPTSH